MTRRVWSTAGGLTITALVGPNRAQMLEIDVPPGARGGDDGVQYRLNRQEVRRLTNALQHWLIETDPRHSYERRHD